MVEKPYYIHPKALVETDQIGTGTRIWAFAHILKGAVIGRGCNIGDHCYIEEGVVIGNEVVVKNGVSLWRGITIGDRVFIGPNVAFTNDRFPRAKIYREKYDSSTIKEGASIGANATLIGPITVGCYAIIGAGAVITKDVLDYALVFGTPVEIKRFVCRCGQRLSLEPFEDGEETCSCGNRFKKMGDSVFPIGVK
jgi:UDP-2-acetamido-3-amino-2,3-dideoxy-glucuronate N-acetyltransferase